jgi:hypothetical protein
MAQQMHAAESPTAPRLANFIIGGTEKAGTTSVFDYLSAHPEVCTSSIKETDFFRHDYTGDLAADTRRYARFFEHCKPGSRVLLEASPGYLGEAATVAPRLRALVPAAKVLFILRDPVERLYSSYNFHRGKLDLPATMSFDDYLGHCVDYDRRIAEPNSSGLDPWYLKVLRFGCYAEFISVFRSQLPATQLKVMFFESLRDDARAFMNELSGYLGIDPGFWSGFVFQKSNVTFSGRNRSLHRLAMRINAISEPLMRRYPGLKRALVSTYKVVNQEREGYDPMSAPARQRLIEFYAPSVRALEDLGTTLPSAWQYLRRSAGSK